MAAESQNSPSSKPHDSTSSPTKKPTKHTGVQTECNNHQPPSTTISEYKIKHAHINEPILPYEFEEEEHSM
ncbi:hypothetical protein MW887_002456 [Aspergillus wentii]|nr:hypothetical protein MW887_002456 [Aspergillus wentii]